MPLLTITNLLTNPIVFQDPTGLAAVSLLVPASSTLSNQAVTLDQLAALEPALIAEKTAGAITWSTVDDPAQQIDRLPEHLVTVLVTPYNAVAGDTDILTNLTIAGAVSVVLSAAAQIGKRVSVVDAKGDAGANNITITVAGGGTVNGGASTVISTNRGQAYLVKTGATAWLSVRLAA